MKNRLKRRFEYLYKGEGFAILTFIFLVPFVSYTYPNLQLFSLISFWVSFFLLEFILIQGTYYWYSKWKRLTTENISITPKKTVTYLRKLKVVNIWILILAVIAVIIDISMYYPSLPMAGLIVSGCILIFAFLEFINYFYIQLSYDKRSDLQYLLRTRKLKRSCLSKDFKQMNEWLVYDRQNLLLYFIKNHLFCQSDKIDGF